MKPLDRRNFLKRTGFVGLGLFATPRLLGAEEALTPPQTEGPFFPVTEQADRDIDLTQVQGRKERARGDVVAIRVQVRDRANNPVAGAVVDLWQACWSGRYNHPRDPNDAALDPNFQYWAHAATNAQGLLTVRTIIPGAYPASRNWMRPPHIHFRVDAWERTRLTTQMYFKSHQELHAADHLLRQTARQHGKAAADSLIVAFDEQTDDGKPLGTFRIVLGKTPEAH